ncbi:hypothetical protein CSB09_02200 [Candidatus Gracilibacteria bacterium]|nr:MAG: hypothetical protein CSB09_02200 [Candidatus Gracilibacteria bacterium]
MTLSHIPRGPENEEYYQVLDRVLKVLFPEMDEKLRQKNLDFSKELAEFGQKNHISNIGDFVEKKGYKLYGAKRVQGYIDTILTDEEKEEILQGRILLGFLMLEPGELYFVLVYDKQGNIKKLLKKLHGQFGRGMQGKFV